MTFGGGFGGTSPGGGDSAITALGYVLNFGGLALVGDLGDHFEYEAPADGSVRSTLDPRTEATIPKTSVLKALAWSSVLGDSTTIVKAKRNGVVVATVAWTGASGIDTSLSVPFTEGADKISWEFDAGTAPDETALTPYFEAP